MILKTCITALALAASASAVAETRCDQILKKIGDQLADVNCFESADLTTNNPLTTPLDNSLPGLPAFAFVPRTDRSILINALVSPPVTTPITKAVPGVQINARIASDPTGQARFLIRLPNDWNGRLVVGGAPAQRSEFTNDFAWSDYVVQKGYAFASQNKGVLNFYLTTSADPLGCRLNPSSATYVHFYDDDPGKPFTQWTQYMVAAARLARDGVKGAYGKWPKYTYAVGTSNGGYQVRRAIEVAPDLFDGGVDWEGTYVDEPAPNILTDLPPAVLNYPDYFTSGFNPNSTAAKNIIGAGYPPDIVIGTDSFWGRYNASYWELTMCQWQKRLDPTYNTYVSGLSTYNYVQRLSFSDVGANMAAIATTGLIQRPLITVAGTMDALLPIDHHARAYQRAVQAGYQLRHGADPHRPAYRLYEVQNGNHIEFYKTFYPQLEYLLFHAQRAFDLLVAHVEGDDSLPPDQCIPKGGSISSTPSQPGHCANLFVP
jgi:hypothetical protein